MKRFLALISILCFLLCSCNKPNPSTDETISDNKTADSNSTDRNFVVNDEGMFTDNDVNTEHTDGVKISFNGDTITSDSEKVRIADNIVTITYEDTFILSGTLNDGMIIVDAKPTDKPTLVFNGLSITSSTSAPVYILNADKVFITLEKESKNTLANGGEFVAIDENNIDAAVFSKQDLTFNGSGSLTVTSPAGHGIVSKDDLVFTGGTYNITSASHGIDANDSVRITTASITIDAGKDGIHAENSDDASLGFVYISSGTFNIESEGDGISAASTMQIEDGTFNILTGGGSVNASKQTSDSWGGFKDNMGGMGGKTPFRPTSTTTFTDETTTSSDGSTSIKALKSAGNMLINNGNFTINSADDSVHSNSSVTVNGGVFEIASGDDGFHADETLTVTSGTVNITESYEGIEALDINITGGNVSLVASDDGLNAAGGNDLSGFEGPRGNDNFGGMRGKGGMGGMGGMSSSSNGSITISDGVLYIKASGDGIDANGTIEITGGNITVCGPDRGDTATLDYDVSAVISGGTFMGTGASGMAQSFSDSKQGVVAVTVGSQSANTLITLKNKNGDTVVSYAPELDFSVIIFSNHDIISGDTYTLTVGTQSDSVTAN